MANSMDRDGLAQRMARQARVSLLAGGLAARIAGERYLGVTLDREAYARQLRAALGGLKGPLMKLAQFLATIPGAVPAEFAAELSQLQAQAPAMGWAFVKRRMAAELGPDWRARFREFESSAAAAASLGQVHRAIGPDGRALACKLQYPGMETAVEADLRQIEMIIHLFRRYERAISTDEIHAELAERLREELDYRREARNMRLYADMLRDEPDIHVPEPVPALSTNRLLTMSWMEGRPVPDAVARQAEMRERIAMMLFRAWYVPFFRYGVIHGDPHLGNYTVRPDGTLNLLDFGSVRAVPPRLVQGVVELYQAVRSGDDERAAAAYRAWRFRDLTPELLKVLNIWARFVFAPALDDRSRPLDGGEEHYGLALAEQVHRELRRVGGVNVPGEFVLMDRVAIGLSGVFVLLKAELNWHRMLEDVTRSFDPAALERDQAALLARYGIAVPD